MSDARRVCYVTRSQAMILMSSGQIDLLLVHIHHTIMTAHAVRLAKRDEGRRLPPVVPPINFALVAPGVYRSGHPNRKNFSFLRTLNLKGVM